MFVHLAQEGPPAQPPGGGMLQFVLFMVILGAVWWFLVLGPQRKAEKARRAKLDGISKGDRVRTRGGIEGIVSRVQDDVVVLRIDTEGKVLVPFAKAYVDEVLTDPAATPSDESK